MILHFCRGDVWNSSESWDTSNPNLSPCLRDVIIPSVPCGLLWLTLPIWHFWVQNYKPKLKVKKPGIGKSLAGRWTRLFLAKWFLHCTIIILSILELLWRIWRQHLNIGFAVSDVFYPACLFATTLLSLNMMVREKLHCIRSSMLASLFWPLLTIALLPNVKVEIESLLGNFGKRFVSTIVHIT